MTHDSLQVLIVDDSRIFRSAVEDALKGLPGVQVVGSVWNGDKAIDFVRDSPPDLVTLDLNMPGRGGLETLDEIRRLSQSRPDRAPVGILLLSALTERGAAVTVEGLARGAFDFIRKPDGPDRAANAAALRQELHDKIRLFSLRRRRAASATSPPPAPADAPPVAAGGRYRAVVIGSSTGGPEALATILPELTRHASAPLFLVQHLPQGMTRYFAESLARKCSYRVVEASHTEGVEARTAYVAPGGKHMIVRRHLDGRQIALNDQPPENGCRPSVDVLFRSVAEAYPRSVLAIVLSGMGTDGARGLGPLKRKGAYVIAQDEATSVVWGMPGAAVATGIVDEILPLDRIGPRAAALLGNASP
ncbi:chemotaxis-specific protein-glutamate methyltransferase CheB [Aquisphaera insulae]|uniref:chemotaxis-specific protein-glutamate methyltransferase CheB n=1 Tax=Aquisphaera insulae TaxID=2712864 RepID=UPI0013E9F62C|nr:chemotaxis-specific protein-glutamate methyltransferase CheB [Aquisphaera insulae]